MKHSVDNKVRTLTCKKIKNVPVELNKTCISAEVFRMNERPRSLFFWACLYFRQRVITMTAMECARVCVCVCLDRI